MLGHSKFAEWCSILQKTQRAKVKAWIEDQINPDGLSRHDYPSSVKKIEEQNLRRCTLSHNSVGQLLEKY